MNPLEIANQYFDAWNRRDAAAIVATFADGGTYSDPTSGTLTGSAIGSYASQLWTTFPDLRFEIVSAGQTAPDAVAAQWVMRGTDTGGFAGLPPTGLSVTLPGADFLTVSSGKVRSVQGYFDSRGVPDQLGLQIVVQPRRAGPFTFGTAIAVQSGKESKPGAFSITELKAAPGEAEKVSEYSRQIGIELGDIPGFIGWVGLTIGDRMMTVTAWEDISSIDKLRGEGSHKQALDAFMQGKIGDGGYTSVWAPSRINPQRVRCPNCRMMTAYEKTQGQCACGTTLPRPRPYW
jgi:steroid delta-isomerase-like uncharacterized protein